jgi:hypothetical protein
MRKINEPWEVSQDKPPSTPAGAIQFLKDWMTQKMGKEKDDEPERPLIDVVTEMIKNNPEEWWLGHHFGWGMSMRNLLREHGYGERELGLNSTLDDYYIAWIEQACLGVGNHYHKVADQEHE